MNFMPAACRRKFANVDRTTYTVEQVWFNGLKFRKYAFCEFEVIFVQ